MAIEDICLAPPELADEIFSGQSILRNILEKILSSPFAPEHHPGEGVNSEQFL